MKVSAKTPGFYDFGHGPIEIPGGKEFDIPDGAAIGKWMTPLCSKAKACKMIQDKARAVKYGTPVSPTAHLATAPRSFPAPTPAPAAPAPSDVADEDLEALTAPAKP